MHGILTGNLTVNLLILSGRAQKTMPVQEAMYRCRVSTHIILSNRKKIENKGSHVLSYL